MSNQIQMRRGLDSQRVGTVFSNGEPIWCTDTNQFWIGDGVTPGGRTVSISDMPYIRNAYSTFFNQNVDVNTVAEAFDFIFNFMNNVATTIYYGDVVSNAPIQDANVFFASLTSMPYVGGAKDIVYYSNYSYRVFAYPKSYGLMADIEDPSFNNTSIGNTYENPPRIVNYQNLDFYVYMGINQNLSTEGKTIRYLV